MNQDVISRKLGKRSKEENRLPVVKILESDEN